MPRISTLLLTIVLSSAACAKQPPPTIDELRSRSFIATLTTVRDMPDGNGYNARVVAYSSEGLAVHALIATPTMTMPAAGFPILVTNHGHHPEPANYGITASGEDSRPGDYYRQVIELFVAHGFLVVAPDYRGHNTSEGFEYTEGMLEASYYTADVLNLISALDQVEKADSDNVFMWGHSMGGEVSLRTLLVSDQISAATIWSSVGGSIWDQSYYYSRYEDPDADDSSDTPKYVIERLRSRIAALDGSYDTELNEPLRYLKHLGTPVVIQHGTADTGAAFKWSQQLAKELYMRDKPYLLYAYDTSDHLFSGELLEQAVARDVAWFRSHMRPGKP